MSALATPAAPRSAADERRSSPTVAIAVGLLTLAAFVLRLTQIHQSIIEDEISTYYDIFRHSFGTVLSTVHTGSENSPPLYFLLAWVSAKLGDPTVWIRLPSVVLGAATVPVVYLLGRDTVGRTAGLIGAFVVGLTPFAVFYGVEARAYATMTFFVALSTLALIRAVHGGSRWWWLAYVASAVAAAYSHYTCIFVLGIQALWAMWVCRGRPRDPLVANTLIVLLYLPWVPHLRGKSLAVIGGLYPLTAKRVLTDLARPIPGHPSAPLHAIPTIPGLILVGLVVLAGIVAVVRSQPWSWKLPRAPSELALLVALTLASPIGLLIYSVTVTDLWLPRGLSASLPAAALVLGALIVALPRPIMIAAAVLVGAIVIFGTIRGLDPAYGRGPFRTIAADFDRSAGPRDPLILASYLGQQSITAQLKKPHLIVNSAAAARRSIGGPEPRLFVAIDPIFARAFHIVGAPSEPGFRPVAHKHYTGQFPMDVWTYRLAG